MNLPTNIQQVVAASNPEFTIDQNKKKKFITTVVAASPIEAIRLRIKGTSLLTTSGKWLPCTPAAISAIVEDSPLIIAEKTRNTQEHRLYSVAMPHHSTGEVRWCENRHVPQEFKRTITDWGGVMISNCPPLVADNPDEFVWKSKSYRLGFTEEQSQTFRDMYNFLSVAVKLGSEAPEIGGIWVGRDKQLMRDPVYIAGSVNVAGNLFEKQAQHAASQH